MIETAYSWEKQPYPAYQLTNLRASIRRDRERIEEVKARAQRAEAAERNGGVTVEIDREAARVTFAEKPGRATLDTLRAAGFTWRGGSWCGPAANLPDEIADGNEDSHPDGEIPDDDREAIQPGDYRYYDRSTQ